MEHYLIVSALSKKLGVDTHVPQPVTFLLTINYFYHCNHKITTIVDFLIPSVKIFFNLKITVHFLNEI